MGNCTKSILYGTIITGITLMLMFSATVNLEQAFAKPPGACNDWPQCMKGGGNGGDEDPTIELIVCDDETSIAKWKETDPADSDGLQDQIFYKIVDVAGVRDSVIADVRAGVEKWNTVDANDDSVLDSPYQLVETSGDADITIELFFKITPGFILGAATVNCADENGITSVSISLGIKGLKSNGIQNLAAHEVGHGIGLGHTINVNNDLMSPSLEAKERKNQICPSNLDVDALDEGTSTYSVTVWTQLAC